MNSSCIELALNLMNNNVFQGDDVFIHGFNLPEGFTIEQFAEKLFKEGLKKGDRDSILSTIALMPHHKEIEETIMNYVGRGKYRVILKIPEEIEGIFLGKCEKKYGDAGNQYSVNSVLDLLQMPNIPPEFIVGIVYTEKHYYEPGEENPLQFIQNPGYYDNFDFSSENSKRLADRLMDILNNSPGNEITRYIMTGKGKDAVEQYIATISNSPIIEHFNEKYSNFVNQRKKYEEQKNMSGKINNGIMPENSRDELVKFSEEIKEEEYAPTQQDPAEQISTPPNNRHRNDYDMLP